MLTLRRLLWTWAMFMATTIACAVFVSLGSYRCVTITGGETDGLGGPPIGAFETTGPVCGQSAGQGWLGLTLWVIGVTLVAVVSWKSFPRPEHRESRLVEVPA